MATPNLAGSPAVLRGFNTVRVLQTVRSRGPLSRPEIAGETGLSKPTVNEIVDELVRDGYVSESIAGRGRPLRPGPRPRLVTFRADQGHVLGIDIGGDKILTLAADLNGDILASERRRTGPPGRLGAEALMREVVAVSRAALSAAGSSPGQLKAVCAGTPGVIDPASGEVALAPQIVGWEGTRPAASLAHEFGCPVFAEKEVDLSLVAERWRGAAQGIDDAVYFQLGIGIGAGVLIGGELYRGAGGAAGEVGYLPVACGDERPELGFGQFEWAASGIAFARLGQAAAASEDGARLRELAGGDPTAVDAETVFRAAAGGDPAAGAIVEELTGRIARGIAAVVCVLNPTTVIVGGGISRAGDGLLEPLKRHLAGLVPVPPQLVLSVLGDEAGALGAVRLATQSVEEELFATIASGGR